MMAKAAVRDVGRVMSLPLSLVDRVAKMIPDGPKVTIKKALEESPDLNDLYVSDPQIKELIDRAASIEGSVRQPGVHAAGVVIANRPLIEILPLYKVSGREEIITQFTKDEIEALGFLKIDVLGLKNLTIIEDCLNLMKENHGVELDWNKIGYDDPKVYELLQRGDGFGVFQVESSGMREMLKRALPSRFEDIVALIALYRPGPMQFLESFISRKHGREPITYLHPDMKEALEDTYGLMIYQEQVMQVANRLAGFSLGEADILRRAMGKKKPEEMAKMRKKFETGCAKNGIRAAPAGVIFDSISQFAQYGFPKSHAASYAVLTYRTAYLKAHYPAEYMAALLTNEIRGGASDKLGLYVGVAREMGLAVLQPDINLSGTFFSVVGGSIRFGLAAIKNVGQGAADNIIEARRGEGPFASFLDFARRIDQAKANARTVECLIRVGAFDSLGATRPQLLAVMNDTLEMGAAYREQKESGQFSLFDAAGPASAPEGDFDSIPLPSVADWTDRETLETEKELVGFFLSGHPLDRFRPDIQSFSTAGCGEVAAMEDGKAVELVGMITKVRQIPTKKGDLMAFVEIEDFGGKCEVVVFPRVFDQTREFLFADSVIYVKGRTSKRDTDETAKVLADALQRIEDLRRSRTKFIDITLSAPEITTADLESLRSLLRNHRGNLPVRLRLDCEKGSQVVVLTDPRFKVNPSDIFLRDFEKLDFQKSLRFASQ
jgi:DNA polymerase-3 subunit alpha